MSAEERQHNIAELEDEINALAMRLFLGFRMDNDYTCDELDSRDHMEHLISAMRARIYNMARESE